MGVNQSYTSQVLETLTIDSGLKSRFLFCLIFQFYLMYLLICQKPAHFLSAQIALVSTFFQIFIVIWMYNFGVKTKKNKKLTLKFTITDLTNYYCTYGHMPRIFWTSIKISVILWQQINIMKYKTLPIIFG